MGNTIIPANKGHKNISKLLESLRKDSTSLPKSLRKSLKNNKNKK